MRDETKRTQNRKPFSKSKFPSVHNGYIVDLFNKGHNYIPSNWDVNILMPWDLRLVDV
jgi:hypothetical protein